MYVGVWGGKGLKSFLYLTDGKTEAGVSEGGCEELILRKRVLPVDSPLYIHSLN